MPHQLLSGGDFKAELFGCIFLSGASITEGPKAFAWLLGQMEDKPGLSLSGMHRLTALLNTLHLTLRASSRNFFPLIQMLLSNECHCLCVSLSK